MRQPAPPYHCDQQTLRLRYQRARPIEVPAPQMISDPKSAIGSAFVKSLDILLRYARLYGFEHARTADQLRIAFEELVAAMPASAGLLLGAAGSRLLLDGVPLEDAAEKQFAHMLSARSEERRVGK